MINLIITSVVIYKISKYQELKAQDQHIIPKEEIKNNVTKVIAIIIGVIISAILIIAFIQASTWITFTSATSHFTVQFPSQPQYSSGSSPVPNTSLSVNYETYASKEPNGSEYGVTTATYPISTVGVITDPNKLLDGFVGAFVDGMKNLKLTSSTPTYYGSNNALDFKTNDPIDNISFYGRAILVGQTIYVLMEGFGNENSANYSKFINSFEVTQ